MDFALESDGAKLAFLAVVVASGMLGGLAAELLKTRKIGGRSETGVLEGSKKLTSRFYDLGTPASLVVGVVAAILAVALLQPIDEVLPPGAEPGTEPTSEYDLLRLIAIAIVGGFAAPKFLTLAQERFLALVTTERFETALGAIDKTTGGAANEAPEREAAVKAIVADALLTEPEN